MTEKTLIELIEEIINYSKEYQETKSDPVLMLIKDRASVLAERLSVSDTAALCFAIVIRAGSFGSMPSRSEIQGHLPPDTNIADRLRSLWELLDAQLIRSYQPNRNPIRHYYIDQEVAEMILSNQVPKKQNTNTLFPDVNCRIQLLSKDSQSKDYLIMLDGKQIGFVLRKSAGNGFEIYWNGNLIFESESMNEIKERLNDFLDEKKL